MQMYRLEHLDDATLRRELHRHVAGERSRTAVVIAHIAEFDARRLYLAEAYPSMFAYCVGELRFSEDAAYKRIQAGRAARRYPRIFEDVAEGRLHLSAVCLLAPHLTVENLDELVALASHRSKAQIEAGLAARVTPSMEATPAPRARVTVFRPRASKAVAAGHADRLAPGQVDLPLLPAEAPDEPAPRQVDVPARYVVQIPIGEATHAKLRRAVDLLGHAVPSGDLGAVFDRALDALLARLDTRKHAALRQPVSRTAKRALAQIPRHSRTVPAPVRRAVWVRDEGRCTFTSDVGRRCDARRGLEYDHVVPFARGGESTVEGLRLRCRAHNQFEAERVFGRDFMERKRQGLDRHEGPV
jgi:5-methylcytosine-specific restriction endonuclease McrA